MKISITKTRIKELNEALKGNSGKEKLYQRCNAIQTISYSYINQHINAAGNMPNGITDKSRIIYQEAEKLVAEREKEIMDQASLEAYHKIREEEIALKTQPKIKRKRIKEAKGG